MPDRSRQCVFCRIARGEASAWVVYEDDTAIAFLDTRPIAPGHILVCPKRHAERLTTLGDSPDLTRALRHVADLVERRLSSDYNIGANQGARAGQVVFHHHWHVIPRYEGEDGESWHRTELTDEQAAQILTKLGLEPVKRGQKVREAAADR
jgi:histidine triad (HIT) family protein